jgi:hypothetical protein
MTFLMDLFTTGPMRQQTFDIVANRLESNSQFGSVPEALLSAAFPRRTNALLVGPVGFPGGRFFFERNRTLSRSA